MDILERVNGFIEGLPGRFEPKGDVFCLEAVIAERKAFLSKQKLTYYARFKVDGPKGLVTFTEKLEERKSGLGAGGVDESVGTGFKGWKTSSSADGLEGVMEEQSRLFGEKYQYSFDFKRVREAVRRAAEEAGFSFEYRLWGKL